MLKDVLKPDNEDFGFTKVCISKRRTKLNYDIWCDSLGREREKNIQPFIMICNTVADKEEWLTISIDKSGSSWVIVGAKHPQPQCLC